MTLLLFDHTGKECLESPEVRKRVHAERPVLQIDMSGDFNWYMSEFIARTVVHPLGIDRATASLGRHQHC